MPRPIQLTDKAREILMRSTITATTLKLPEQLERSDYDAVMKAIAAAGGKWMKSLKLHVFNQDPRKALQLAAESGEIRDDKKDRQAFFTPKTIAAKAAGIACEYGESVSSDRVRILEPSAGEGALAEAAKELGAAVLCIEIHPQSVAKLEKRFRTITGDFLTMKPGPNLFDAVLMNPPFTAGQYIQHVLHAWKFLKPGGALVAIVPPTWRWGTTKANVQFREFVAEFEVDTEELPAGTFSESGTNVATVLITLLKPCER